MRKYTIAIALGIVSILAGAVALFALAQRLIERGLEADANGTAGFTTTGDIVQGIAGLILIAAGIALTVVGFIHSRKSAPLSA